MKSKLTLPHLLSFLFLLAFSNRQFAQISIPNGSFTNTENFSTLASTGTSTVVPTGWAFFETGTNANTTYTAGTGSSNTGDTYSFGPTNDTERAFGGLQSGSLTPTVGVCYTNNTGQTINSLTVTYTGETWRIGTANRPDGVSFQYNINTTAINGAGTWTAFPSLDYFNPGFTSTGSGSMLHSALISAPITGINIPAGNTFCFRWVSFDASGADDGIAIDDYTLNNIVLPSVPVTLTCPVNTSTAACQTQAAINAEFSAWLATASGSGGCDGVLTNNNTGAPSACGGSTTVTFTYTSTCEPFTTTCQATFTVNAPPTVVLTCPMNMTTAACQTQSQVNEAFANWLASASASGGCNGVLTNNNTGAPSACGGSTTVTFTYTSSCAPTTTTCQATFTVAAPPVVTLSCPLNTTVSACQTQSEVNETFAIWLSTASGAGGCNGALTNNNIGAPSACGGSTTVTFTYTSSCAPTTTTCQATFTVSAPAPVVLTCPVNQTVQAGQSQTEIDAQFAAWLATASASGGCNGMLSNNNTGAPPTTGGSTTVTFTYTSSCAPTTTTCQATFTVSAVVPVTLTCPMNVTEGACLLQDTINARYTRWLASASASGGCNGVLTNNSTGAPSACGGSTTVTFTYTSTCAPTTTTCQATFTVTAAPTVVLTCPINTTVTACQTQAAVNTAFANWLATASASGGCNGVLTNNNTGAPPACGGSTTVTFTYTSACAPTTTTCQATFTVTAAPTVFLTCPTNTTVAACQTQAAVNTAFANWLATASASGGCNGVLTNNNIGAPPACGGSTTVTFTYTSGCAPTTTTCQATFTVAAPSPVVLTCPADTTASACLTQAQMNTAYANWLASVSVSGGCGGSVTNNAPAAPLICNPNATVITVTFTYSSPNCGAQNTSCTATFTVPAYPDFVMPANTASQVACPSQIVQPTPPTVSDGCGKTLTPSGPVIVNNPNPITCEGTRTFTWTYTDCSGKSKTWSHVTTVERQPFSVPANGGATVACPDQTDTQPTPPAVISNCGEVLTPVVTSTAKPGCEGNRNWNFTYTDCEGNTATWVFIYTVEYLDFTVPASETVTVECPLNASQPTPPVVKDNCGKTLTPTGPVITSTNNASGCEGSRSYAWTYKDCEGNTHVWSKTFNFQYTADFFVYPDGEDFVGCLLYAQPPVPPTIYGICGEVLKVTGPTVVDNSDGCSGTRKFTYIYSDCGGHSHPWTFTYHAKDTEPPVGVCPNVDETDLACIEDVPCIDGYDFSDKIQELLAAGGFYDVCSGNNLTVSIESWTPLWQCSDADGDGVYTFGRTFNFLIQDACGNGFPSFCSVTYSGKCQPINTYSQAEWGNEGGEPGSSTPNGDTDLQTITTLLGQGPLTIGGNSRSLTLTSAQCVLNLLPGVGNPTILGNCVQTNCNGCNPAGPIGMKNSLATNTIALMLNMRFNVQYNGLTLANVRSQELGCIEIDPNIETCTEGGVCKLHIFETGGPEHTFPYTLGGLLDLANLYLNGGLNLTGAESAVYAAALNKTIQRVNEYWHDGTVATTCNPAGGAPAMADAPQKSLPSAKPTFKSALDFSLAPNPANSEVNLQIDGFAEAQEVIFELYNSLGQQVLRKEFGKVSFVKERIDLSGVMPGMYIVSIKAGEQRMAKKLVINR